MKPGGWVRAALIAAAAALAAAFLSSRGARVATAQHQAFMVRAGDLDLRAVRAGHGRPIILLHGYGESLVAWQGVFDRLAFSGDVIALDLPGFGLSSKPAGGYATEALATDVVRALDALGVRRAVIVGHSMGGAVAAALALLAPERVSALVLIAPALVGVPWIVTAAPDTGAGTARAAIAEYEALRTRFTGPHAPGWLAESDSALAYAPAGDSAYTVALAAVLREFDFDYLTPQRRARLRAPILLIWGQFDPLFPLESGRRLAAELPGARLEVIGRSWHRPQVERPAETAEVMERFLRQLPAPAGDSP